MPNKYYCLVSGLPEISLTDNKLSLSGAELKELLMQDLTPADYLFVETLEYEALNAQIINYLYKKEYNFSGFRYNEDDLEEFLQEIPENAPLYLQNFFKEFREKENLDEIQSSALLASCFYNWIQKSDNSFLRNYFSLEQRIRNILTAIICRNYDLPLETQIIGDDHISVMLKNNKNRDFGLSGELEYSDELFKISEETNLLNREKMLDNLRFNWLEDQLFFESFTIEAVLGFVLRFKMVERWLKLDVETGKEMFEKIFKGVQETFEMPEAYKL